MPTKEEINTFKESGALDALDELIKKIDASSSNIVPVGPYYKAGGKIISMGVRWWGLQNGVVDSNSPTDSFSIEVTARLGDDEIAIYDGKNLATKISRQQ